MRSSKEGKPLARSPLVVEQLRQFILIAQYVRVLVLGQSPQEKVDSFSIFWISTPVLEGAVTTRSTSERE